MSPKAPPTPDYSQMAKDQGAANLEAGKQAGYINNPNVNGPYGSRNITFDPVTGQPTINETLSEGEQSKYDLTNQAGIQGLEALLEYGMPAIEKAMSGSFKLDGSPQSTIRDREDFQTYSGIDGAPPGVGSLNFGGAPGLQDDLNYGSLGAMPDGSDAARQSAIDALYSQGARFLDKRFSRQRSDVNADLAAQGITDGSAAEKRVNEEVSEEERAAYGDLSDRAISAGGAEHSRMFGLGMQNRQQGASELTNQGQFRNAARGQYTGEEETKGSFANQSRQMFIDQILANMGAKNNALAQQGTLDLAKAGLYNSARGQANTELQQEKLLPINVMNALMSGSQVNTPTYQPYNGQGVEAAPIYQAGKDTYQANLNRTNAQNAMTGQIIGLGGSLATAGIIRK